MEAVAGYLLRSEWGREMFLWLPRQTRPGKVATQPCLEIHKPIKSFQVKTRGVLQPPFRHLWDKSCIGRIVLGDVTSLSPPCLLAIYTRHNKLILWGPGALAHSQRLLLFTLSRILVEIIYYEVLMHGATHLLTVSQLTHRVKVIHSSWLTCKWWWWDVTPLCYNETDCWPC